MKIAIKINPTRGKEIIKILSDLGGKHSLYRGNGTNKSYCYFIDKKNNNEIEYYIPPTDYKIYTLEEFEKEFPFKIGNIVLLKGTNNPHKIVALEWFVNKLCYKLDNGFHYTSKALTIYKEMKEKRNITLTLDKAKEWYNKGGELKEIALQAFTEKELTKVDLPKTWEEFCKNYPIKNGECYTGACSEIHILPEFGEGRDVEMDKNVCPSQKSAEAHLAMIQLEQLRDCWRQGWVQTPTDAGCRINKTLNGDYVVMSVGSCKYFLAFPTRKMAEEFLECFRDLIEKAGDLI